MSETRKGLHCNHCGTTIVSMHRHDFVWCKCEDKDKSIYVDGGFDYFRYGWGNNAAFTEVTVPLDYKGE